MNKLLNSSGIWIKKSIWGIIAFAVGLALGLAFSEKSISLASISSLGTFGAAAAAFWAVSINSRDQRRKWSQEEQARRPYLVVSEADFSITNGEVGFASITFTNLSQHPVHIRDAVILSDDDHPDVTTVGLLILASATVVYKTPYNVHFIDAGRLIFMFSYAFTGPTLHSLSLPYGRGRSIPAVDGWPEYQYAPVSFDLNSQKVETNVEDESKRAREFVDKIYDQQ